MNYAPTIKDKETNFSLSFQKRVFEKKMTPMHVIFEMTCMGVVNYSPHSANVPT